MVLKEVPTGKIEIVNNGRQLVLQFNCSCADALPYCGGACCAYRPFYNAEINANEVPLYQHLKVPGAYVLDYQKENGHCVYHNARTDNLCAIYQHRPCVCRETHCSPGGVGEGVTNRQGGWLLTPKI